MAARPLFFLIVALFALFISESEATDDSYPAPVCYYKKQKCCYKYAPCGYFYNKVPISKRCDFKKCDRVCKKNCYTKEQKVPYEHCYYKSTRQGKKRVCETKYKYVKKPYCERKCYHVCYLYKAICKGYKLFKYAKYCAKLECGAYYYEGKREEPKPYYSQKGIFVEDKYTDKHIIRKVPIKKNE